jgi:hypothetical protein
VNVHEVGPQSYLRDVHRVVGVRAGRVRRALGRAEQSRGNTLSWPIGDDPDALGPTLVLLEITFDARDRVVDTQIGSRPY